MGGCHLWLIVGINLYFVSKNISVSADYLLGLWIPDNELLARIRHRVELVEVHSLACSAAGSTERNLAQTANFLHHIWRVEPRNYINLVVTLVRETQAFILGKFLLEDFSWYRINYFFFHHFILNGYGCFYIKVCRQCLLHIRPIAPECGSCRMSGKESACRK